MEKTLNFKIDGKEYKLGFNRDTVCETERLGFRINEAFDTPVTSLTLLWRGAFLEYHPTLETAEVDAIFNKVKHDGLFLALLDLYKAPVESLFDEEHEKNAAKWTVT